MTTATPHQFFFQNCSFLARVQCMYYTPAPAFEARICEAQKIRYKIPVFSIKNVKYKRASAVCEPEQVSFCTRRHNFFSRHFLFLCENFAASNTLSFVTVYWEKVASNSLDFEIDKNNHLKLRSKCFFWIIDIGDLSTRYPLRVASARIL